MVGVTNSISDNWKQSHIYKYSHLKLWFDGTDVKNKAPNKNDIIMGSMNPTASRCVAQDYNGQNVCTYYQSNPGIWNGFFILHTNPDALLTWDNCTMTIWGYRLVDTNTNPLFFIVSTEGTSTPAIFNILFKDGTANNGFVRCTNAIGQNFAWSNNTWKFIACTLSSTTVSVYINGNLLTSAARTKTYQPGWSGAYMLSGTWKRDAAGGTGKVADFRIYDYAMTADEIQSIYSTGPQHYNR